MTRPASVSAGLGTRPGGGGPVTAYARIVLDAVDRIPAGRVLTYGDVAELTGRGTGRTVGTALSRHGREVPWWRVVQASGRPAEPHVREALRLLRAEGCVVHGEVVDLSVARWDGRTPAAR
ncbi:MAG: MGMT family protein [Actinomycetota bacterium]|nr:MGMT family protein [Actinomycetota bacterium]